MNYNTFVKKVIPKYLDLNNDPTQSPLQSPSRLDEESDGLPNVNR